MNLSELSSDQLHRRLSELVETLEACRAARDVDTDAYGNITPQANQLFDQQVTAIQTEFRSIIDELLTPYRTEPNNNTSEYDNNRGGRRKRSKKRRRF
jgi:hypothetical protein